MSTMLLKTLLRNESARLQHLADKLSDDDGIPLQADDLHTARQVTLQHFQSLLDELTMNAYLRRELNVNMDYLHKLVQLIDTMK